MRIYGNHFIFPFSDNNNNQFNTQDGKTEATQTATKRSFFLGPSFDDEKTMMPWCSIQADGNRDLLGAINASAIYVRAWFQVKCLSTSSGGFTKLPRNQILIDEKNLNNFVRLLG